MKKPDYKTVFGIGLLCFLGSFINTMGFMKYSIPMSHVTGNFVKSISSIVSGKIDVFIFVVGAPLCFLLGTIISGVFFKNRSFDFGKNYGRYLLCLGVMLSLTTTFFHVKEYFIYFICLITGMQNGMYINYKGSTCRTTHITGTMTDFGILIGNHLGGNKENSYKLHYYFINISSALSGMVAGGFTYNIFQDHGFYLPAMGYFIVGVTCLSNRVPFLKIR